MSPEFWVGFREYLIDNPAQRFGQAFFNYLYQVNPAVADEIRTTPMDPFYNDANVGFAINYARVKGV